MPQDQPPPSLADGEAGDYQAFSDGGDKETLRGETAAQDLQLTQEGVLSPSQLPSRTINMITHTWTHTHTDVGRGAKSAALSAQTSTRPGQFSLSINKLILEGGGGGGDML